MSLNARALHYVLKIGNLRKNLEFFRDKLGMTVLRHEVFDKGCDAACNGPYDGKWSKTMIGYGPEDNNFVLELTYNYSIGKYKLGNDLQYIKIALEGQQFKRVEAETTDRSPDGNLALESPDGYKFIVASRELVGSRQDVVEVCLSCTNLKRSMDYWIDLLKMNPYGDSSIEKEALLRYADTQASLRLKQIDTEVDHKSAYGRIAFSCPSANLKPIQKLIEDANQKVLTPFLSLDTPGKATVQVVILADPDGHEICFVGDEGFRELSQIDVQADELIEKSIREDKSDEWFEKKKKDKMEA